mmetsp:Transcript_12271/g.24845  ORF Transcript_12271/g.24845 Transcript_12271/m.24845 type:complete len:95 (+) Transcript_12271:1174-1458(+)
MANSLGRTVNKKSQTDNNIDQPLLHLLDNLRRQSLYLLRVIWSVLWLNWWISSKMRDGQNGGFPSCEPKIWCRLSMLQTASPGPLAHATSSSWC